MNCYREENPCCYYHPKEVLVGICALCLKERLLALAAKQGHRRPLPKDTHRSFAILRRKPTITLARVFALGSFLHRLESRPQRPEDDSEEGSIASLEDSFISIKFEDNGRALWDNKRAAASLEASSKPIGGGGTCNQGLTEESKGGRSVVEHTNQRGTLRWRKRIGHLLQLARWKRSNKAGSCHVGLAGQEEGVKGRRGWIGRLTRRRATSTRD